MKIALFGKLRSGKSAVCNYIAENYNCDVIEFSGGVQEVVDVLYPECKGVKNRGLLIDVGQHLRKLDENVWVNVVKHKILNSNKENILVAGVRQRNEYEMLKELGFTFIQVEASENTRIERCKQAGDKFDIETLRNHTEMVMDEWTPDYLILNEYGFKELEIATNNIITNIINEELREAFFREGYKQFLERAEVEGADS